MVRMRRVYLDMCSLKRPFDDQRQPRVRAEASALAALVAQAEAGQIALVRSPRLAARHADDLRTLVALPPAIAWGDHP